MLEEKLLMLRNKSALSLKLPSRIHFIMHLSGGCCPARPTGGNEPEECSPELIRWEGKINHARDKLWISQRPDFAACPYLIVGA